MLFAAAELSTLTGSVTEKGVHCRRLKDQLDTLEKETTEKLDQMEQYNKELQVSQVLKRRRGRSQFFTGQLCAPSPSDAAIRVEPQHIAV